MHLALACNLPALLYRVSSATVAVEVEWRKVAVSVGLWRRCEEGGRWWLAVVV